MFTKKMEAVMAEEFEDATLETEISLEMGEVQWMRQGVVIQPGPRYTLAQNGCKRTLTIHNLTLSDRGTYRCETLHDRTQVKLNVERKWSKVALVCCQRCLGMSSVWVDLFMLYNTLLKVRVSNCGQKVDC